jgi:hypothetical protein
MPLKVLWGFNLVGSNEKPLGKKGGEGNAMDAMDVEGRIVKT